MEGRLGGSKTFRYLVVPDSAGSITIPAVTYPYYDLGMRAYRSASVGPASLPVAVSQEASTSAALPPELMDESSPALAWRITRAVPDWVWLIVVCFRRSPRWSDRRCDIVVEWQHRRLRPGFEPPRRPSTPSSAVWCRTRIIGRGPGWRPRCERPALTRRPHPGWPLFASGSWLAGMVLPAFMTEDAALTAEVEELVTRLGGSLRGWRGEAATAVGLFLGVDYRRSRGTVAATRAVVPVRRAPGGSRGL